MAILTATAPAEDIAVGMGTGGAGRRADPAHGGSSAPASA